MIFPKKLLKYRTARAAYRFVNHNAPTLCTIVAVGGVVVTVGLAVKATPKCIDILEEMDNNGATKKERIKAVAPTLAPVILSGVITIGCIIGGNYISATRIEALSAALSLSNKAKVAYEDAAKEILGEEKAEEIKDKAAVKEAGRPPKEPDKVLNTGKGDTLYYEPYSGRWFRSNPAAIDAAENRCNRDMTTSNIEYSMNEYYYELGLPEIYAGELLGWNPNNASGLISIKPVPAINDVGEPYIILAHYNEPSVKYRHCMI